MGGYRATLTGRDRRRNRVRKKVSGTAERPRLSVFRSNANIFAQLIDDTTGVTIAAASTLEKDIKGGLKSCGNIEAAKKIGATVAKRAIEKGFDKAVFDRGGYIFHGRVKALAEAAREAGLNF